MESPFFITGLSRSGKTILSAMLNCHPNLMVPHHRVPFGKVYRRGTGVTDRQSMESYVRSLLDFSPAEVQEDFREENLAEIVSEATPTREGGFVQFLQYLGRRRGKKRCGVQLSVWNVAEAMASFPQSKFIHLSRDPRDRYADRLIDRADRLKGSLRLLVKETVSWRQAMEQAEDLQVSRPASFRTFRYEDMVRDPASFLRAVCSFLGERTTSVDQMIAGIEMVGGRGSKTPYGPLTAEHLRIGARTLQEQELSLIWLLSRKMMKAYGYAFDSPKPLSGRQRLGLQGLRLGACYIYACVFGGARALWPPAKRIPRRYKKSHAKESKESHPQVNLHQ